MLARGDYRARSQWAANVAKDTDKSVSFLADDYTEFNPGYPARIDGAWKLVHANFAPVGD